MANVHEHVGQPWLVDGTSNVWLFACAEFFCWHSINTDRLEKTIMLMTSGAPDPEFLDPAGSRPDPEM